MDSNWKGGGHGLECCQTINRADQGLPATSKAFMATGRSTVAGRQLSLPVVARIPNKALIPCCVERMVCYSIEKSITYIYMGVGEMGSI